MPDKEKVKQWTTKKLFTMAAKMERAAENAKTFGKEKETLQTQIVQQMQLRGVRSLRSDEDGMQITLSKREWLEYDEAGLFAALNEDERKEVFRKEINLNALPPKVQRRILKSLKDDEIALAVRHKLDTELLAQAVQANKVRAKKVAKFATPRESKPWITPSHPSSK